MVNSWTFTLKSFGHVAFFVPLHRGDACVEGVPSEIRLETLTLRISPKLMAINKFKAHILID